MFTKESGRRHALDFKIEFNEAIAFAEEKQETLALRLGVTQGAVNNWCNPNSDRNFPMALFTVLPQRMQLFLMNYLNHGHAGEKFAGLNGSIDDEIISLMMLESDLKKQAETDPRKAKATIVKMREMLNRAEKEVENIASTAR